MSACLEIQPLPSMNQVGSIDHYTLIVECAETVAHFHADVLGFELLESVLSILGRPNPAATIC